VEQSQFEIPGGCNFVGWFDIGRTNDQIAHAFESAGWKVSTLEQRTEASEGAPPVAMVLEKNGSRLSLSEGDPNVFSGELATPDAEVVAIRRILYDLSLMLICRWRDQAGREWRDIPMMPEMMGIDPATLSDSDRVAMAASYARQPVSTNSGTAASSARQSVSANSGKSASRSGCLGLFLLAAGAGGIILEIVYRV
jgi:hypothetical protein